MVVTKKIEFCFGHRLPNYPGKCHNLHGHTGVVEVSFSSIDPQARNQYGMIVDFFDIRKISQDWINDNWDHGFICNYRDKEMVEFLTQTGSKHFFVTPESLGLSIPEGQDAPLATTNPTMENLTQVLAVAINQEVRKFNVTNSPQVKLVNLRMYESSGNWCDLNG